MKKALLIALFVPVCLALAACFGEEPANAEADIEAVSLHLDDPESVFYHEYDTMQTVSSVSDSLGFLARSKAPVGAYPLTLTLTAGATVEILSEGQWADFQNGSTVDFSGEQVHSFRVTSEDRAWQREYKICVKLDPSSTEAGLVLTFDFNGNFALSNPEKTEDDKQVYYVWTETDETNIAELFGDESWKCGNPGFKLSKSSAKPMEYPTIPVRSGGPDGTDCVKMETMDTGAFGKMVNMLIAAGSFFNGYFDVANALKDARKATQFGLPFKHKPLSMSVWMKCEMGDTFQDKAGNTVEGVVDEPDAYLVLYRNQDEDGNQVLLDGDDVLSSPYIVGLARLPHNYNADGTDLVSGSPIHGVTSEWQEFILEMEYTAEVDQDLLESNGYSLVIGFASSWQGAYFIGAPGSKLWIDNVTVTCE